MVSTRQARRNMKNFMRTNKINSYERLRIRDVFKDITKTKLENDLDHNRKLMSLILQVNIDFHTIQPNNFEHFDNQSTFLFK